MKLRGRANREDRFATATHEAAHAVIMELLGQRVGFVTIDKTVSDKGSLGMVEKAEDLSYYVTHNAAATAAGIAAELELLPLIDENAFWRHHHVEMDKVVELYLAPYQEGRRDGDYEGIRDLVRELNKAVDMVEEAFEVERFPLGKFTDENIRDNDELATEFGIFGATVSLHQIRALFKKEKNIRQAIFAVREELIAKKTIQGDRVRKIVSKYFTPSPSTGRKL